MAPDSVVSVGLQLDLKDAKTQLESFKADFEGLKQSFKDAPNATAAFNEGINRSIDMVDLLSKKIEKAEKSDSSEDGVQKDLAAGLEELATMKKLFSGNGAFSTDIAKGMFNGLSTAIQKELNANTNEIGTMIRSSIHSLRSSTVSGMASELMQTAKAQEIFANFKHTDSQTFRKYVEALLPRVAPTHLFDDYSLLRYGTTNTGSKNATPQSIIPSGFQKSYAAGKYVSSYADVPSGYMQPIQRNALKNVVMNSDAAMRAAEKTQGMIHYDNNGRAAFAYSITPKMYDEFRQNLFDDFINRSSGMASRRINPFSESLTESDQRKLVGRMTSSSAGRALSAMRDIEALSASRDLWTSYTHGNGFEQLEKEAKRSLEQYEVAKYTFDSLFNQTGKSSKVTISESPNTRILGLQGQHNQFTDKVLLVSASGWDQKNADQNAFMDKLLARKPIEIPGTGKKYIAQNLHGTGEHAVLRMIEADAYEQVRKQEAEWAKANGFGATNFWNDFIREDYDFGDIQALRKHYDATGKGWSPGFRVQANWQDKNFGVIDLTKINDKGVKEKLADGLAWFADGIMPIQDFQGRAGVSNKGTFHTLKGFSTMGDWARSVGIIKEGERFILPGPMGDVDLTDLHGMTDVSEIKNISVGMNKNGERVILPEAYENFKTSGALNDAYTALMRRYGASVMASYEDAETRARGLGSQAMAFVKLSPKMQEQQMQELNRRMRLLDTEAGIREYLLGDPDNYLGQQLRAGKITARDWSVQAWARSERESLIDRASSGEWIDFGEQPSVINQMLNKNPLSAILGLNVNGDRKALLDEIRKRYSAIKGKELTLSDEDLAGVFALDKGQVVDFSHPEEDLVSIIRSPSLFGNFTYGKNYAKLAKDIYETFGFSTKGGYLSMKDMDIIGDADWDGDRAKFMYGDIAEAVKEAADLHEEMTKAVGSYSEVIEKPVEINAPNGFKDTTEHWRLTFGSNANTGYAIGQASEGGMRASEVDLTNPLNRDYLIAAIQSNKAYAAATAQAKKGTEVQMTQELKDALYLNKTWSKLPTRYSRIFNTTGKDGMEIPDEKDIAKIKIGDNDVAINLAELRGLDFDKINFRSIFTPSDVAGLQTVMEVSKNGVDMTRAQALLTALDQYIGYGDAGEKTRALMQNLRTMKVHDIMNPGGVMGEDELRDLETMRAAAEEEIKKQAHELFPDNEKEYKSYIAKKENEYGITAARSFVERGIHQRNINAVLSNVPGSEKYLSYFLDEQRSPLALPNKPSYEMAKQVDVEKESAIVKAKDEEIKQINQETEVRKNRIADLNKELQGNDDVQKKRAELDAEIAKEQARLEQDRKDKIAAHEIEQNENEWLWGPKHPYKVPTEEELNDIIKTQRSNLENAQRTLQLDQYNLDNLPDSDGPGTSNRKDAEERVAQDKAYIDGIRERLDLAEKSKKAYYGELTSPRLEDLKRERDTYGKSEEQLRLEKEVNDLEARKNTAMEERDQSASLIKNTYDYIAAQEKYNALMGRTKDFSNTLDSNIRKKEAELEGTPEAQIYYARNIGQAYGIAKDLKAFTKEDIFKQLSPDFQQEITQLLSEKNGLIANVEKDFAETTEVKAKRLYESFDKAYRKQDGPASALRLQFEQYDKRLDTARGYRDQLYRNLESPTLQPELRKEMKQHYDEAKSNLILAEQTMNKLKEADVTSALDKYQEQFKNPFEKITEGADAAKKEVTELIDLLKDTYSQQGYSDKEIDEKVAPYKNIEKSIDERTNLLLRKEKRDQTVRKDNNIQQSKRNALFLVSEATGEQISAEDYAKIQGEEIRNKIKHRRTELKDLLSDKNLDKDERAAYENELAQLNGIDLRSVYGQYLGIAKANENIRNINNAKTTKSLERLFSGSTGLSLNDMISDAVENAQLQVEQAIKSLGLNNKQAKALRRRFSNTDQITQSITEQFEAQQEAENIQNIQREAQLRETLTGRRMTPTERADLAVMNARKDANAYRLSLIRQSRRTGISDDERNALLAQAEAWNPNNLDFSGYRNRVLNSSEQSDKIRERSLVMEQREMEARLSGRQMTQQERIAQTADSLKKSRDELYSKLINENKQADAQKLSQTYTDAFLDKLAQDRVKSSDEVARIARDNNYANAMRQLEAQERAIDYSRQDFNRQRMQRLSITGFGKNVDSYVNRAVQLERSNDQRRREIERLKGENTRIDEELKTATGEDKENKLKQKEINTASIESYNRQIANTTDEVNNLTGVSGLLSAAMDTAGQAVGRLAQRLGRQLFQQAYTEAKRFVKEFNASMASIQMITLKTDSQMSTLGSSLIDRAKELKVSVSEITQSAESLYRQGLTDEEVNDRLGVISKFSKVSGTKVDAATKLITVAMNTGLVSNPQTAADVVTALGDSAATNAAEIEKGIEKAGAAAAVDGTTFGQLASMLTAITSTTQIGGNVAGRTINTIFARLNKIGANELIYDENGNAVSGSDVAEQLKAVGVDTYVNGKKRSGFDVLYDLSQKWDTLSDARQQQLSTSIAGTRMYSNFAAIMQGMSEGDIDKYLQLVDESAGITDKKYEVYTKTLEASLNNLRTTFDGLINDLTSSGFLTGLIDGFAAMVQGIDNVTKSAGGLAAIIPILTSVATLLVGINMMKMPGMGHAGMITAGVGLLATAGFGVASYLSGSKDTRAASDRYNEASEQYSETVQARYGKSARLQELKDNKNRTTEEDKEYLDLITRYAKDLGMTNVQTSAEGTITPINNLSAAISGLGEAADNAAQSVLDEADKREKEYWAATEINSNRLTSAQSIEDRINAGIKEENEAGTRYSPFYQDLIGFNNLDVNGKTEVVNKLLNNPGAVEGFMKAMQNAAMQEAYFKDENFQNFGRFLDPKYNGIDEFKNNVLSNYILGSDSAKFVDYAIGQVVQSLMGDPNEIIENPIKKIAELEYSKWFKNQIRKIDPKGSLVSDTDLDYFGEIAATEWMRTGDSLASYNKVMAEYPTFESMQSQWKALLEAQPTMPFDNNKNYRNPITGQTASGKELNAQWLKEQNETAQQKQQVTEEKKESQDGNISTSTNVSAKTDGNVININIDNNINVGSNKDATTDESSTISGSFGDTSDADEAKEKAVTSPAPPFSDEQIKQIDYLADVLSERTIVTGEKKAKAEQAFMLADLETKQAVNSKIEGYKLETERKNSPDNFVSETITHPSSSLSNSDSSRKAQDAEEAKRKASTTPTPPPHNDTQIDINNIADIMSGRKYASPETKAEAFRTYRLADAETQKAVQTRIAASALNYNPEEESPSDKLANKTKDVAKTSVQQDRKIVPFGSEAKINEEQKEQIEEQKRLDNLSKNAAQMKKFYDTLPAGIASDTAMTVAARGVYNERLKKESEQQVVETPQQEKQDKYDTNTLAPMLSKEELAKRASDLQMPSAGQQSRFSIANKRPYILPEVSGSDKTINKSAFDNTLDSIITFDEKANRYSLNSGMNGLSATLQFITDAYTAITENTPDKDSYIDLLEFARSAGALDEFFTREDGSSFLPESREEWEDLFKGPFNIDGFTSVREGLMQSIVDAINNEITNQKEMPRTSISDWPLLASAGISDAARGKPVSAKEAQRLKPEEWTEVAAEETSKSVIGNVLNRDDFSDYAKGITDAAATDSLITALLSGNYRSLESFDKYLSENVNAEKAFNNLLGSNAQLQAVMSQVSKNEAGKLVAPDDIVDQIYQAIQGSGSVYAERTLTTQEKARMAQAGFEGLLNNDWFISQGSRDTEIKRINELIATRKKENANADVSDLEGDLEKAKDRGFLNDTQRQYLKEAIGNDRLYNKVINAAEQDAELEDEEQKYILDILENRRAGLTSLTAGQQLRGIQDVRQAIASGRTIGTEQGNYSLDVANAYMSGFTGWDEYLAYKQMENLAPEQQKHLDALEAQLDEYQKNAQIEFEVEGIQELENAGKVAAGTAEEIKKLKEGGKVTIDVLMNIRSEAFTSGQQRAKLNGGNVLDQDEAAMAVLGMSREEYYANRNENLQAARNYDETYLQAQEAEKWRQEYLNAPKENRGDILRYAGIAGFELKTDNKRMEDLLAGASSAAERQEILNRAANEKYGKFVYTGARYQEAHPAAGTQKTYSDYELLNARNQIISGSMERTSENKDLYDAAYSGLGEYGRELIRRQIAGEEPSGNLTELAEYEQDQALRNYYQQRRSEVTENAQMLYLATKDNLDSSDYSALSSYLGRDVDQIKEMMNTQAADSNVSLLVSELNERKNNLMREIIEDMKSAISSADIDLGADALDNLDLSNIGDFDSLVDAVVESAGEAGDEVKNVLEGFRAAFNGVSNQTKSFEEAYDDTLADMNAPILTRQGLQTIRDNMDEALDYTKKNPGKSVKDYFAQEGKWDTELNGALNNSLAVAGMEILGNYQQYSNFQFTKGLFDNILDTQIYGRTKDSSYYAGLGKGLFGNYVNNNGEFNLDGFDKSKSDGLLSLLETIQGDKSLSTFFDEWTNGIGQLSDVINELSKGNVDKAKKALEEFNKQMADSRAKDVTNYSKSVDGLDSIVAGLMKGGTDATKALTTLDQKLKKIQKQNSALKSASGKSGAQLKSEKEAADKAGNSDDTLQNIADLTGYSVDDLTKMSAKEIQQLADDWLPVLQEQFDTIFSTMLEAINVNPEINLADAIHVQADGSIDVSPIEGVIDAASAEILQKILTLAGDYAQADLQAVLKGQTVTISAIVNALRGAGVKSGRGGGGGGSKGGGGGSGGGKSDLDKMLEAQKERIASIKHRNTLLGIYAEDAARENDNGTFQSLIGQQIQGETELRDALQSNLAALQAQSASVEAQSEDWYKLQDAIRSAEEEIAKYNANIAELESKMLQEVKQKYDYDTAITSHASSMLDIANRGNQRYNDFSAWRENIAQRAATYREQIATDRSYAQDVQARINEQIAQGNGDTDYTRELIEELNKIIESSADLYDKIEELGSEVVSLNSTMKSNAMITPTHLATMYESESDIARRNRDWAAASENYDLQGANNAKQREILQADITRVTEDLKNAVINSQEWHDLLQQIYSDEEALIQLSVSDMDIVVQRINDVKSAYDEIFTRMQSAESLEQANAKISQFEGDYSDAFTHLNNYVGTLQKRNSATSQYITRLEEMLKEAETPEAAYEIQTLIDEARSNQAQIQQDLNSVWDERLSLFNEKHERETSPMRHELTMLDYREQVDSSLNHYDDYVATIDDMNDVHRNMIATLTDQRTELQAEQSLVDKNTTAWWNYQKQIETITKSVLDETKAIDDNNKKRLDALKIRQQNQDRMGNHALEMLSLSAEREQISENDAGYAEVLETRLDELRNNIELNKTQQAEAETLLSRYNVGEQKWLETRDLIWSIKKDTAAKENEALKLLIQLDEQRLAIIQRDATRKSAYDNHAIKELDVAGGLYQSYGDFEQQRNVLTKTSEAYERIKQTATEARDAMLLQMDSLEKGKSEWYKARDAAYAYDETIANATAKILQNRLAIENSRAQELTTAFNSSQLIPNLRLQDVRNRKQRYDYANDHSGVQRSMQEESEILKQQVEDRKAYVENMKALLAEMTKGTPAWYAQRQAIAQALADISSMEAQIDQLDYQMNQSRVDYILDRMNNDESNRQHNLTLVQYAQTKYQNAGELTNYGTSLKRENELLIESIEAHQREIEELKEQQELAKDDPKLYNRLTEEIKKKEEAMAASTAELEKNTKAIKENDEAILKTRKDLEDQVDKEIRAREEERKKRLNAEVSLQKTILETIKKRYSDEWDLQKKDIEKKQDALKKEKSLINERLDARKKAMETEEKYSELEELQRQLALISNDPTRTKDVKGLREQIQNIQKDMMWEQASEEAENSTQRIEDEIQAMSDYSTVHGENLQEMLANANNFAEEIAQIMAGGWDSISTFLMNNNTEFKNSLEPAQKEMIESWENTWKQMNGIVDTYWGEIDDILSSYESFIGFMKGSVEYLSASETGQKIVVENWAEVYDNYIKAQINNASKDSHIHDYLEGSLNLPELEDIGDTSWMDDGNDVLKDVIETITDIPDYNDHGINPEDTEEKFPTTKIEHNDDLEDIGTTSGEPTEGDYSLSNFFKDLSQSFTDAIASGAISFSGPVVTVDKTIDPGYDIPQFGSKRTTVSTPDYSYPDYTQYGTSRPSNEEPWYKGDYGQKSTPKAGSKTTVPAVSSVIGSGTTSSSSNAGGSSDINNEKKNKTENTKTVYYNSLNPTELFSTPGDAANAASFYKNLAQSGNDTESVDMWSSNNNVLSKQVSSTESVSPVGVDKQTVYDENLEKIRKRYGKVTKNAEGGLIDYTGLAWVDGTLTKPESFLDAEDTLLLQKMTDALGYVSLNKGIWPDASVMSGGNTTYGNISIVINEAELKEDADYEDVARRVGKAISKEMSKKGYNMTGYNL